MSKMWLDMKRLAYIGYTSNNAPIAVDISTMRQMINDALSMDEDINAFLEPDYWVTLEDSDSVRYIDDLSYDPGMPLEDALSVSYEAYCTTGEHTYMVSQRKGGKVAVNIDGRPPKIFQSIPFAYALIQGGEDNRDFNVFTGWFPWTGMEKKTGAF